MKLNQIHPQYVIDDEGKPQGVLLKINEFEELVETAQDVMDAREIEQLKAEPRFSWEDVKAKREAE